MSNNIIIAGIHTGIGKTICSAVLCQALGYDYWKPVQAGDLENSDSIFIKKMVSNSACTIHDEAYKLTIAASPHYAAAQDAVEIKLDNLHVPITSNHLIIETAGGLMSPLSMQLLNIDLVAHLQLPVILVSNNYLGSINHTLLSIEALQRRNIPILGLVFSGDEVESTRDFILAYSGLPLLFSIPPFETIDAPSIQQFAATLAINL
jgi:dethiobiotin synthetase